MRQPSIAANIGRAVRGAWSFPAAVAAVIALLVAAPGYVTGAYAQAPTEALVSGYADSGPGRLVQRGSAFVDSGACETNGTVAQPAYSYTLDQAIDVPATVRANAGIGRIGP